VATSIGDIAASWSYVRLSSMKAEPLVTTTFPVDVGGGGDAQRRPEPPLPRGLLMTMEDREAEDTMGLWLVIRERVVGEMGADRLMLWAPPPE
jgi:hypothetical protein